MSANRFQRALQRKNTGRPPVWMMRQAGRYHSHYQKLKEKHTFVELCKLPEVACEAAMGPMRDFGFDAAILFSDLLFPLEVLGMDLQYIPGPSLSWHLRTKDDLSKFMPINSDLKTSLQKLQFQADALMLTREALDREFGKNEKGLLGFVGGPLTLYSYAVEGSHQGNFQSVKNGFLDGRFDGFLQRLLPLLIENILMQAKAGADTVAILDTCAGEVSFEEYREYVLPSLKFVLAEVHRVLPELKLTYYSKKTGYKHFDELSKLDFACLGVDWNNSIVDVLKRYGDRIGIQGNINPDWLFHENKNLENELREVFLAVQELPEQYRSGWVCGLGHGILQKTPENNVKTFVKVVHEVFTP